MFLLKSTYISFNFFWQGGRAKDQGGCNALHRHYIFNTPPRLPGKSETKPQEVKRNHWEELLHVFVSTLIIWSDIEAGE